MSVSFITSLMTTQKWRAEIHHLFHHKGDGHQYSPSLMVNPQPQPRAYPPLPLGYTITCDQQWDIFLLSSFPNVLYNLFHNYNNLKWKTFQLKSCKSGDELQLSYILFSIWGHLKILKIWNSKFKPCICVPKQPQLKKLSTTKL